MLACEAGTFQALHQAWSVLVTWDTDADIAGALLHDDAENDTWLYTHLGSLNDGIVHELDVTVGIARQLHGRLVDVEQGLEVFPGLLGWEG